MNTNSIWKYCMDNTLMFEETTVARGTVARGTVQPVRKYSEIG